MRTTHLSTQMWLYPSVLALLLVALTLLVTAVTGCSLTTSEDDLDARSADLFAVHVQRFYHETPIRLKLDNQVILDDTVTTSLFLGVASIVPVDIQNGRHQLRATVDGKVSAEKTFVVKDTLYLVVNYDRERQEIIFGAQRTGFLYY